MGSWFFFSYARDDQDSFLTKFYADLCTEIRLATKLAEDEVGFLDQNNIQIGDVWSAKLKDALRTCKVMVSICSPNYFDREYCGKEFQVCVGRQAKSAKSSTALFSVIWGMPTGSVHPSMKKFQYTHRSLPSIYAKEGLRYMMKLDRHKDDYEQFLTRFARAIVQVGSKHPLTELGTSPSFDDVVNPFGKTKKTSGTFQRNAFFTYVAGGPDELPGLPRKLPQHRMQRYGSDGRDWRPFYPDYQDSVGNVAMLATAKQKLFYKEFPVDENLVTSIREAEKNRQIVILLVDPWTIRVKTYRELMEEYDRANFENCAVLVAWNSPDKLTKAQRQTLQKELNRTFKFRARYKRSVYYVDAISSNRDLRTTLAKTLVRLRNSLIETSDWQQGIKDTALSKRALEQGIALESQPIVSGPGDPGR